MDSEAQSFRRLFDETYPAIVAYARRRLPAQDVDDLVAEVYTTAWRRWPAVVANDVAANSNPLPWLYGVAGNVLRNLRRSNDRRLRLVERIESQPAMGGPADPAELAGADLRLALSRLSFEDQEVLRLVAWEGLSHAEAGESLDCTANAVGVRLHRARQRLETELHRLDQNHPPTSVKEF